MRNLESRAQRHWRRDELALRMVQHGARSSTVSAWTGLSANRIRSLVQHNAGVPPVRHRGQPPQRLGFFFRSLWVNTHAAALASHFLLMDLLPDTNVGIPAQDFRTIDRGEKLCHAFEMYVAEVNPALIPFDYAVLLATALAEGADISLQPCPQCEAAMLVDHFALATDACTHCRPSARLPPIPGRPMEPLPAERFRRAAIQLRMFGPPVPELLPAHSATAEESSPGASPADRAASDAVGHDLDPS